MNTRHITVRLLRRLSIYFFCLAALAAVSCNDYSARESRDHRPGWTKKSYWKDDHAFHAVGVHSGHFISERDAYFSALRELAQFIDTYGTVTGQGKSEDATDLELAGIITCKSNKADSKVSGQGLSEKASSPRNTTVSEQYASEFRKRPDGVDARYYISAAGSDYRMEIAHECSTKDFAETLERIPVADTYYERNHGLVTTYVMIDYAAGYQAAQPGAK